MSEYWGLTNLSRFLNWFEELIAILSKPCLMIGFVVSTLDLLTQGRLLNIGLIFYGWALVQAVAIDATFFVVWHKFKKAIVNRDLLAVLGYFLLGAALGTVAWAAMDLQSLEQTLGIANNEALARLNLNPVVLTHLRSLVAVIMGAIIAMIGPDSHTLVKKRHNMIRLPKWLITSLRWCGFKMNHVEQAVQQEVQKPLLKIKRFNMGIIDMLDQVVPDVAQPHVELVENIYTEPHTEHHLELVQYSKKGDTGDKVKRFIETELGQGHVPTLKEIMDATECSKGTASNYKNLLCSKSTA